MVGCFVGCLLENINHCGGEGACGVMGILAGNGHGVTSSNPGRTDCISPSLNTLGKGMNSIIYPPG